MQLDMENNNSEWYIAIKLGMESMESKGGIRLLLTNAKKGHHCTKRISQDQGASSVCCQV